MKAVKDVVETGDLEVIFKKLCAIEHETALLLVATGEGYYVFDDFQKHALYLIGAARSMNGIIKNARKARIDDGSFCPENDRYGGDHVYECGCNDTRRRRLGLMRKICDRCILYMCRDCGRMDDRKDD